MAPPEPSKQVVDKPARISYAFIAVVFILAGWLHLATPLLAVLFAYLALTKLHFAKRRGKWLAIVFFLVLILGIAYGLGHFINQAVRALPEIADKAIPTIIQWGKAHHIQLPFSDYDSFKELAFDTVKSEVRYLGSFAKFARGASAQFVFLVVGCVVAISLFLHPSLELNRNSHNLYSACCEAIEERFTNLYRSFVIVMGAQIIISAINTLLTAGFVAAVRLPYALVVIGMTFLCGLLPVIGNLISNTIIVAIGFTVSPRMALAALIFLVVVHKTEYLLNSKIIGGRIQNPLWLTLLALVLGERLMGIPGMILAPVVLSYIKIESSGIEVNR